MPASYRANDGLTSQLDNLWDAALNKSTRVTYMSAFKCFQRFLILNGVYGDSNNSVPYIDENQLLYFVTYCQKTLNLKYQTIKLYLAGIRHFIIRLGGYDPMANNVRLPIILRGIQKSQVNSTKERLPITAAVLEELCTLLSRGVFSAFKDLMLQCAFKMAYFGFLRCGEFTRCKADSAFTVRLQDIRVDSSQEFYIFNLGSSKCDPFHKGVNIAIYENPIFKPVDTMIKYIKLRLNLGASQISPLFVEDEFDFRPLSRDTFLALLRNLLDRLGYDNCKFSGHSFRIGAATSAAAAGVEDHIIQCLGRWSSDCYIRYIRVNSKVLQGAQNDMCFST